MKIKLNKEILSNYFDRLIDLIFPKKCINCGKFGNYFCSDCLEKIDYIKNPFCPLCHRLTPIGQYCYFCRRKPDIYLTGVIIAAYYRGSLRQAIHTYKYKYIRELAKDLSKILIKRLDFGFPRGNLILIPVPLHKKREAWRGFNQASDLAKKIGRAYDIPLYEEILVKKKKTKPQVKLKGDERKQNIRDAFAVNRQTDFKPIQKKTILLVDDLMTTGTTLNECAKILREIGCRRIWGLVLAKG